MHEQWSEFRRTIHERWRWSDVRHHFGPSWWSTAASVLSTPSPATAARTSGSVAGCPGIYRRIRVVHRLARFVDICRERSLIRDPHCAEFSLALNEKGVFIYKIEPTSDAADVAATYNERRRRLSYVDHRWRAVSVRRYCGTRGCHWPLYAFSQAQPTLIIIDTVLWIRKT